MAKSQSKQTPVKKLNDGAWMMNAALVGNVLALLAHVALVWMYPQSPVSTQGQRIAAADFMAVPASSNQAKKNEETSSAYFEKAATFSGEKGDGYQGWLHLLAAYDLNCDSEEAVTNLVENYRASKLTYLALDELQNILKKSPSHPTALRLLEQLQEEEPEEWTSYQQRKSAASNPPESLKLATPQFTIPFATAFARFDLTGEYPDYHKLNEDFYDATVIAYNEVKEQWKQVNPKITDTELNHKFFQWQMKILRETGQYWEGYTKLKLFHDLMNTMRHSAAQVLEAFGFDKETAQRKAHHEVIFWASVHSADSIHEPHQTEDSLIGGVYYVTIPPNSGVLDLFDPRGKMRGGLTLPNPPFHRVYTIQPKEGMLVLFPGWLVHTVRASKGLNVAKHGYRISISVNLKGEWQDTTKLTLEKVNLTMT